MRLLPIPGVFQPPSDAVMLAQCLRQEPLGPHTSVLDLCAGSGFLGLSAASQGARVTAVDVHWLSLAAVQANALLNGVRVRTARGDLFDAVAGRRFDYIVSNPPYLPGPGEAPGHGRARAWEAGPRGRMFIDRICARATSHLRSGGVLMLVHSSVCSIPETVDRLTQQGLEVRIEASQRGPLGPILRARAGWLRSEGLLEDDGTEEMVVIRAQLPMKLSMADSSAGYPRTDSTTEEVSDGQGPRTEHQERQAVRRSA
ncbi:MAG: methyltransferase [Actinomycetota bacterium]|nr:methyltransferase [Actinomycetota bacterium]